MKKLFFIITILALVFAACNRAPAKVDQATVNYSDTVGLAQFQAWKAQNERFNPNMDYNAYNTPATAPVRTVYRTRSNGSYGSTSTNTARTTAKKGWSKAAKGAVIGAGTGAVLGAVINKRNRVTGAVIGGVLGGGIGYGIGRGMDKKDGRY